MTAVAERFSLPWPFSDDAKRAIKDADLLALATERQELIAPHPDVWPSLEGVQPLGYMSMDIPWKASHASCMFSQRFMVLGASVGRDIGKAHERTSGTST
jgi:hypothetical protein